MPAGPAELPGSAAMVIAASSASGGMRSKVISSGAVAGDHGVRIPVDEPDQRHIAVVAVEVAGPGVPLGDTQGQPADNTDARLEARHERA